MPELASLAGILLLLAGLLPAALLLLTGFLSRISLTRILGLLARLMLSAALLLPGLLLATLLMLGIFGVLRHGVSPLKPAPQLLIYQSSVTDLRP